MASVDDLTRLAIAARGGDRAALAAFVRAAQVDVWRLCAHLGDPEDADDLTQDVLVRAIGALPRFRAESSARTWVLAIARRACADEVRRRTRRRRALGRLGRDPDALPDPAGGVELDLLLGVLDGDRRAAFVLTQIIGLSYEDAADVCGCPVGTIRSRVSRARSELVASLRSSDGNRGAVAGDQGG
jgi:RNA polymerase sigma-70 factor, ECF subfamily